MKRYGNLWDKLISWDNLVLAAHKAQRGKRGRSEVQRFNFFQEMKLLRLQEELSDGTYRPGGFRSHWISRPKPRLISAAPYRDRVVHHALMNVLELILERHFHPNSYACRKEKGSHAAANRLQDLMKHHKYALQCDIRKFFPSIDHEILKEKFRRLIKDRRVLWLMDLIVDTSNEQPGDTIWFSGDNLFTPVERRHGLPIGNLTSQWFANWYLTELDHYITSHLGIGAYVRYCDDFILLHEDRQKLKQARTAVKKRLSIDRLQAHENKMFIRPVRSGLTFVGYRIWHSHRLLKKENIRQFRRRVSWMRKAYADARIDLDYIKPRLFSWMGHAQQADSYRLIRRLSREWKFSRDGANTQSCSPRRQLEQQCNQLPGDQPQQQHALQSEQQHRVPFGSALSTDLVQNHQVYGPGERGFESPGPIPALLGCKSAGGRIYLMEPGGSGRQYADGPVWVRFSKVAA